MARIILTVVSDLFDSDQEASIRDNLPVRTLISETKKEFNLPEDGIFSYRVQSTGKVLDPDKTLEQQGVQTGAVLVFNQEYRAPARRAAIGAPARMALTGPNRAFFREERTGQIYDVSFQPAIIGRPDPANPQSNEFLVVNLGNMEGAKSVSRYHARVTEDRGQFFLESMADHNPAYLNDGIVRMGEKRLLMPGDTVTVGKIKLTFGVRPQTGFQSQVAQQPTTIGQPDQQS